MTLKEASYLLNINLNESVARFAGNENIYTKYLKKFLDDDSMSGFEYAFLKKDTEQIESSAHTIKGVCANLGLYSLSDLAAKIVNLLRNGEEDRIFTDETLISDFRKEYSRICTVISQID